MNRSAKLRRACALAAVASLLAALGFGVRHTRAALAFSSGGLKSIVVVTRDVVAGEVLSRAVLDYRDLPERYLEERHIVADDLERLLGARVRGAVNSGAALLWSDLDLAREGRTLAELVPVGMRAFTLPERDLGFDGALRPGDRVDVMFTPTDHDAVALLQNVLVLTVGTQLGMDLEPAAPQVAALGRVTLSVTLEQAQRLAQSEARGALRLALRNPRDLVLLELVASSTDLEPLASARGQELLDRSRWAEQ
ncbi:MAG: Flp pilus assembly protein RcpC/CpaB [Myxococcaceae bacterium]|nr:Flp pilus assembly protein RcpC/CpaB [Myxococcaceae bacterium]